MRLLWTLTTNAKTETNARTLVGRVQKLLDCPIELLDIEGDRYAGHRVRFRLTLAAGDRAAGFYGLLCRAERLGNSWTLGAIRVGARGWCNRSRIAGIQQLEWQEELSSSSASVST